MKLRLSRRHIAWIALVGALLLTAGVALARPGGGGSFSGGGGGGGGSSGGGGGGSSGGGGGSSGSGDDFISGLIMEVVWALLVLAFENPVYGMPILGVLVLVIAVYAYARQQARGFALGLVAVFVCFATTAFHTVVGLGLSAALLGGAYLHFSGKASAGWVAVSEAIAPAPKVERRRSSAAKVRARLAGIREFDPDFSVVLFEDFLYALYAAVHRARGAQQLDTLAAYVTAPVRQALSETPVASVGDVVIGAMRVVDVRGTEVGASEVRVQVEFEANYTEVGSDGGAHGLYVLERWELTRRHGVRSKPPEKARVLGCPACGANLKTDLEGACEYCKRVVDAGAFDWTVGDVTVLRREERAPVLTAEVEEQGTDFATVRDPEVEPRQEAIGARDPAFDPAGFGRRVRLIFDELQAAWSARAWERVRPYVSDNLFQSQRYWMDAYTRAKLRNVTDGARVTDLEIVRVTSDRWYDAITVRIHATGPDYTVADDGTLVCGHRDRDRAYTEYWTLIRGAGCLGPARTDPVCPKCGAELKINMAGECAFCEAKVTAGAFDWVLSRIEQDETYQG